MLLSEGVTVLQVISLDSLPPQERLSSQIGVELEGCSNLGDDTSINNVLSHTLMIYSPASHVAIIDIASNVSKL